MIDLTIGPLTVGFHRTIKVPQTGISKLPPSLGNFEFYKVLDFKNQCPSWDENDLFIAIHNEEALFLSFHQFATCSEIAPNAILINIEDVNVLNGEKATNTLQKDNYLVVPPQLWLDGWNNKDGTVSQFVVNNDIYDSILSLSVFDSKCPPKTSKSQMSFAGVNIEQGGMINQRVHSDPYGLNTWKEKPIGSQKVHFVNAVEFNKITGKKMLPLPKSFEDYKG